MSSCCTPLYKNELSESYHRVIRADSSEQLHRGASNGDGDLKAESSRNRSSSHAQREPRTPSPQHHRCAHLRLLFRPPLLWFISFEHSTPLSILFVKITEDSEEERSADRHHNHGTVAGDGADHDENNESIYAQLRQGSKPRLDSKSKSASKGRHESDAMSPLSASSASPSSAIGGGAKASATALPFGLEAPPHQKQPQSKHTFAIPVLNSVATTAAAAEPTRGRDGSSSKAAAAAKSSRSGGRCDAGCSVFLHFCNLQYHITLCVFCWMWVSHQRRPQVRSRSALLADRGSIAQ